MDSLKRRNSPKTPKTAKFDAEILLSLYRRGEAVESFPEGAAMTDKNLTVGAFFCLRNKASICLPYAIGGYGNGVHTSLPKLEQEWSATGKGMTSIETSYRSYRRAMDSVNITRQGQANEKEI